MIRCCKDTTITADLLGIILLYYMFNLIQQVFTGILMIKQTAVGYLQPYYPLLAQKCLHFAPQEQQ